MLLKNSDKPQFLDNQEPNKLIVRSNLLQFHLPYFHLSKNEKIRVIKLPFSFEPRRHVVSPLTFLTCSVLNSSSVKLKTITFSAKTMLENRREANNIIRKFLHI